MAWRTRWASIGSEIVSWTWAALPDKYDPLCYFATYEEAEAYAERTHGRVQIHYTLRDPDGGTWELPLWLPDGHSGEAALGCVVVGLSYQVGFSYEGGPTLPTPEEAQAEAKRLGIHTVLERITLRSPAGEHFEVDGALA